MPLDSLYICNRCKSKVDINNVRYDTKGKIVCLNCLGKTEARHYARGKFQGGEENIIKFICVHCRYKFKIRKDSPKKFMCPYCGKSNLMHVKKYKTEDDLISEASDSKYDY